MQTFLPYPSFSKSLNCLDNKRLGKQRVEAMQILDALSPGSKSHWKNHPAVKMWKGFETALKLYHNLSIIVWKGRGFNNSMPFKQIDFSLLNKPDWLNDAFCSAHRSNLLRKDSAFYKKYDWTEPDDLPYVWPK